MRTELLYTTIAALVALTFPACSDDGSSTACAHPTAGPVFPDTALTTTDGGSTSNDTEDNTTADVTDSTSSPTTGGPVDPEHCVPAENSGITCEAGHRIWCGEVDALALEHLPPTYAEIVSDMCDRGDPPCLVCWHLANYCAQVGEDCVDLDLVCGCLAVAHGEVSP